MDAFPTISGLFGAAAGSYDAGADVQFTVAEALAAKVGALPLPAKPRVLEVGCGTGLLTRALARRLNAAPGATPNTAWTITDIAAPMVAHCEKALATELPGARFMVMDGAAPVLSPGFDLIASSLALQWFDDPAGALRRLSALLAPEGQLAFATLGPGTFEEWQAACALSGVAAPARKYLSAQDFKRTLPPGFRISLEQTVIRRTYTDGWAFLQRLRQLGAHRAVPEAQPLSAGALRRVLRATAGPFTVTYDVIYGILSR
jgi:malonyl-CoA O-methyltransferase